MCFVCVWVGFEFKLYYRSNLKRETKILLGNSYVMTQYCRKQLRKSQLMFIFSSSLLCLVYYFVILFLFFWIGKLAFVARLNQRFSSSSCSPLAEIASLGLGGMCWFLLDLILVVYFSIFRTQLIWKFSNAGELLLFRLRGIPIHLYSGSIYELSDSLWVWVCPYSNSNTNTNPCWRSEAVQTHAHQLTQCSLSLSLSVRSRFARHIARYLFVYRLNALCK